jgi:hypothetical protein
MPLSDLSVREREIVHRCLRAVADSERFFADDDEFQTIFAVTRREFVRLAARWPEVDERDPDVSAAIGNALNNLLGYPHAGQASWADHFSFTQDELRDAMAKWWGARPTGYFDTMR